MKRKILVFLRELTDKLQARWPMDKPDGVIIAFIARVQINGMNFDEHYYLRSDRAVAFGKVYNRLKCAKGYTTHTVTLVHSLIDDEDLIIEQSEFAGQQRSAQIGDLLFLNSCPTCGSPTWDAARKIVPSGNCRVCMGAPVELSRTP